MLGNVMLCFVVSGAGEYCPREVADDRPQGSWPPGLVEPHTAWTFGGGGGGVRNGSRPPNQNKKQESVAHMHATTCHRLCTTRIARHRTHATPELHSPQCKQHSRMGGDVCMLVCVLCVCVCSQRACRLAARNCIVRIMYGFTHASLRAVAHLW